MFPGNYQISYPPIGVKVGGATIVGREFVAVGTCVFVAVGKGGGSVFVGRGVLVGGNAVFVNTSVDVNVLIGVNGRVLLGTAGRLVAVEVAVLDGVRVGGYTVHGK